MYEYETYWKSAWKNWTKISSHHHPLWFLLFLINNSVDATNAILQLISSIQQADICCHQLAAYQTHQAIILPIQKRWWMRRWLVCCLLRGAPAHVTSSRKRCCRWYMMVACRCWWWWRNAFECLMKPQLSAVPFAETPLTFYRFVTITRLIIKGEHLKFHYTFVAMIEFI